MPLDLETEITYNRWSEKTRLSAQTRMCKASTDDFTRLLTKYSEHDGLGSQAGEQIEESQKLFYLPVIGCTTNSRNNQGCLIVCNPV